MHNVLRQTCLASTVVAGMAIALAPIAAPMIAHAAPATRTSTSSAAPQTNLQRVAARISDLHERLKISAAEQPQWDAFAKVMLDNAKAMEAIHMPDETELDTATADAQMQAYVKFAAQHAANVAKLAAAFQALYDVMPADQKRIVDQQFRDDALRIRAGKSS